MKGNGWRITRVTAVVSDTCKAYRVKHDDKELNKKFPVKFRLLDGDDQVYFYGRMSQKLHDAGEHIFAPLDDFGLPGYGCTSIETFNTQTGQWEGV